MRKIPQPLLLFIIENSHLFPSIPAIKSFLSLIKGFLDTSKAISSISKGANQIKSQKAQIVINLINSIIDQLVASLIPEKLKITSGIIPIEEILAQVNHQLFKLMVNRKKLEKQQEILKSRSEAEERKTRKIDILSEEIEGLIKFIDEAEKELLPGESIGVRLELKAIREGLL